jgi:hypothetical protein
MALALASCSAANAEAPDPSNPFHCSIAFSVFHGIAKASGGSTARMLERRMTTEAEKEIALPSSRRSRAEGEALRKRLLANPGEAYATVVECMKRQDSEGS